MKPDDPQVHYNLGLTYFKDEKYSSAVDHLKICIQLDKHHPYAYNNLAFIYNMHKYYTETIAVCNTAKASNDNDSETVTNCLRHWAFALFKQGEMAKAIKKIKHAIEVNPADADNWIIWGLIMRTVGSYSQAKHKFEQALRLQPHNETAKFEMDILRKILELDAQISLDQVATIRKIKALQRGEDYEPPSK